MTRNKSITSNQLLMFCAFLMAIPTSLFGQRTIVQTSDGIFTTRQNPSALPLPKEEDAFHFIIYGDRTGGNRAGLKVLRQAVADSNLMDPDFVLTVGDLIQGYNRPDAWQKQADEFREIMSGLKMPWFPVAGNHDVYWDFKDPDRPTFHHEKNFEANFGPLWYSFQHKETGFIMLYTDEGDAESGEKGFNQGRLQNMSPEQIEFLKQALQKYKDLPRVFVAMHHPRWIGGGYSGSNWPEIHKLLVEAGNVNAVFAGHIHRMRYDPKDGIEYFALATTGGNLNADMPEVGMLHHFNVVTVRPNSFTMATVPVGAVIDPRKFEPEFLTDVKVVQNMRPSRSGERMNLSLDGTVSSHYSLSIPNPGKYPLEVAMTPNVAADWRAVPDHQHIVIPPGKTAGMEFYFYRGKDSLKEQRDPWATFKTPTVEMVSDYLHESARIRMPAVTLQVDLGLSDVGDTSFEKDLQNCLVLSGKQAAATRREVYDITTDCARVNSSDLNLPQGPFTLEAWVYPTENDGSRAVAAKTEQSEFAIFLHDGFPQFDVHLSGKYVSPKSPEKLPLNEWSHVAGVFDGQKVSLYVNGKLAKSMEGSGQRRLNSKPFYIGADPDRTGSPTRQFAGRLDEIRLSKGVRYSKQFEPASRFKTDGSTLLLLHLDHENGPILLDDSAPLTTVLKFGGAAIQPR